LTGGTGGAQTWRDAWRRWLAATVALLDATAGLLPASIPLPRLLFLLGLGIYIFTRLFGLGDFPIYFFGDEAAQVLFAERLIDQGFRDQLGIWFPLYVDAAANRWTPMFSMYFHALSLSLFGKSVFVARATSTLVSVLAAAAVSLALKRVFKVRLWWAGVLLLAGAPAFFLHSRTAFETTMAVSFFAGFVSLYLLYRCKSPRYIYPAILVGACAFYTYSNAQVVMAALGALLLIFDFPYHLSNRRTLLSGAALGILAALPLLIFRMRLPEAAGEHLRMINSYWLHSIPVWDKLALFAQKYAYGLSPGYWFWPNSHDLARHRMEGMGHLHQITFPLFLVGLGIALRRLRSAQFRVVILAGLAAPAGAALLEVGITRVLFFTAPAVILMGVGLDWLVQRLEARLQALPGAVRVTEWGVFAALALGSLLLTRTALVDGPTWFQDYGLYGMQYGARQVFAEAIPELLQRYPQAEILVTSVWANGADNFMHFFLDERMCQQVRMDGIESYLFKQRPLDPQAIFIMTPLEYEKLLSSPKLRLVETVGRIPYPNGMPGFYMVRLAYTENAAAIFAIELEARNQLVEALVVVDGEEVILRHSQIDMGEPELMFDGDHFSLMRGLEANPFILEMLYPTPRPVKGLEADFGLMDVNLTVKLFAPGGEDPQLPTVRYTLARQRVTDPIIRMDWDAPPAEVERVRLEIFNPLSGESANIHIRELKILP
jgi:hypothetical protein